MCAPTSVTTVHAVLTSSLLQAYLASQVLSVISIASALGIALRRQLMALAKTSISLGFLKALFHRVVGRCSP